MTGRANRPAIKLLLVGIACMAASLGAAADRATSLFWLNAALNQTKDGIAPIVPGGLSVAMDNIVWDSATALSGKGTVHLRIGDWTAPAMPNIAFSNLQVAADGLTATAGSFVLDALTLPDVLTSGLNAMLPAGTTVTLTQGTPTTMAFSANGPITIQLPFGGPSLNLSKAGNSLNISGASDGTFDLSFKGADANFSVAGFAFKSSSASLSLHHSAGSGTVDAYTFVAKNVDISTPLPDTFTSGDDNLHLSAQQITIDENGGVTTQDASGNVAPATLVLPANQNSQNIGLAKPMGFGLSISQASAAFQNSQLKSFTLSGSVALPPTFTKVPIDPTATPDPNADTAASIAFTADARDHGIVATNTVEFIAYWNGFKVDVPAGSLVLDLSSSAGKSFALPNGTMVQETQLPDDGQNQGTPLDNSWQGIYIAKGSLSLPPGITNPGGSGSPLSPSLANAYIDEHGFSGDVLLTQAGQGAQVEGFPVSLSKCHLKVKNDNILHCDIVGAIGGTGTQSFGLWKGQINIAVSISHAGMVSAQVSTTAPITIPNFASIQLTNGSFSYDPSKANSTSILFSGILQFDPSLPKLGSVAVKVQNVGLDQSGNLHVQSAWIDLPETTDLSVGPLDVQLTQIGFGQDAANNNQPWIDLTGSVSLSGDLPINIQGNFDGLHITPSKVTIRNIGVDCDWEGIFHLQGELAEPDGAPQVPKHQVPLDLDNLVPLPNWPNDPGTNRPMSAMSGHLAMTLGALGDAGLDIRFLLAKGAWFGMVGLNLGDAFIPIGDTGVGLFGFFGGVGHNVTSAQPGATGIPSVDYDLIPDAKAISGQSPSTYIFTAGARIGLVPPVAPPPPATPLWGDIGLTLQIPNVNVDITGNLYLACPIATAIPADPSTMDRVIVGDINYDGPTTTFKASVNADLYFPTRSNWVLHGTGGMDLVIGPVTRHLYVGGPISKGPPISIQNPVQLEIQSPISNVKIDPIQGAITLNFDSGQQPPFMMQAALLAGIHINASGSASIGVDIDYSVKGDADIQGYFQLAVGGTSGTFDPTNISGSGTFTVHVDADVDASSNFPIIGTQTVKLKASADGNLSGTFSTKPADIAISGSVDADLSISFGPWSGTFKLQQKVSQEWKI